MEHTQSIPVSSCATMRIISVSDKGFSLKSDEKESKHSTILVSAIHKWSWKDFSAHQHNIMAWILCLCTQSPRGMWFEDGEGSTS